MSADRRHNPVSSSRREASYSARRRIRHARRKDASMGEFDLMEYLRRSTEESGVPLYVEDLEVIHQAAKIIAGILRDQNFHSTRTRSGSKMND
jgi:hypothetical protein